MNYLGHAYLSFGDAELLTGNMIGDHIKGKLVLEKFPERIKQGIVLHRKIDAYADVHPATQRAKIWFRQDYGLYSGAIMDTLFDHFLANDAKCFASEDELMQFTQRTYAQLEQHTTYFPPTFAAYFPHMQANNWLFNYRNLMGIKRSLNGLARRAKHLPPIDKAYEIFITNYYQLAQCYYELMDDLIRYVKVELSMKNL